MTRILALLFVSLLVAPAFACDQGPDPWHLNRPSEWQWQAEYGTYDASGMRIAATLTLDVCRDDPTTSLDNAYAIVWWSLDYTYIRDSASLADFESLIASVPWYLPPEKRIHPRRRVAR